MNKNNVILTEFIKKFGYLPNHPNELFYDENQYNDLLLRCIKDNLDYTIKMYGTDPNYGTKKHDGIYID